MSDFTAGLRWIFPLPSSNYFLALSLANYTFSGHTHPLGVAEATPCNRCQEKRNNLSASDSSESYKTPTLPFFKKLRLSSPVVKDFNFKYISKEIGFQGFFFIISLLGFGIYINVFLTFYSFSFEQVYSGYQVGAQSSLGNFNSGTQLKVSWSSKISLFSFRNNS